MGLLRNIAIYLAVFSVIFYFVGQFSGRFLLLFIVFGGFGYDLVFLSSALSTSKVWGHIWAFPL